MVLKSSFNRKIPLVKQRIVLLPLDELLPHEQVVQNHVNILKTNLERTKLFFRPIVVAKDLNIILDGHHRVEALREMGYRKIPCIQIPNYLTTEEVTVATWYPIYTGNYIENEAIFAYVKDQEINWVEIAHFSPSSLKDPTLAFVLVTQTSFYQLFGDQKIIYSKIFNRYNPEKIDYVKTMKYAIQTIKNRGGSFALLRKALTKEEVIKITRDQEVFAPKTTRHILTFRYQDIRVSLENLK